MADSIIDVIHRITYEVAGEQSLARIADLFQQNGAAIGRNLASIQRLQRMLDATSDPARQAKLKQAIDNRQLAIKREGSALQETILYNKQFQQTVRQEIGIIGELNMRLQHLRTARDKATDVNSLRRYNKDIAELERERAGLVGTAPIPASSGRAAGVLTSIGRGITQGLGIAGGFAVAEAVSQMKQFTVESFRAAANFEQMQVAFATMTGNRSSGDKLLKQIQDFAAITPYGTTALVELSKQLLAYGFHADEIIPTIDMLGNVAAGVGADKMPQLILAFGQIRAAGKLTGQDLLQLINAGFNPLQIISEQTGQSMTKLKDDMSKGLITFDQVKNAFRAATSEGGKFNSLMQQQSKTTAGRIDALGDSVEQLQIAIGNRLTGSVGVATEALTTLVETVTQWLALSPADEIEKERIQFNLLVQELIAANKEGRNRSAIISELNAKYPDLIKNIDLESASNAQLVGFMQLVNKQYEARIRLAGAAAVAEKEQQKAVAGSAKIQQANLEARRKLIEIGVPEQTLAGVNFSELTPENYRDVAANVISQTEGLGLGGDDLIRKQLAGVAFRNRSLNRYSDAVKQANESLQDVKNETDERVVITNQLKEAERKLKNLEDQRDQLTSRSVQTPVSQAQLNTTLESIIAQRENIRYLNRRIIELDTEVEESVTTTTTTSTETKANKKGRSAKEDDPIKEAIERAKSQAADLRDLENKIRRNQQQIAVVNTLYDGYLQSAQHQIDSPEVRGIRQNERDRAVRALEAENRVYEQEIKLRNIDLEINELTKVKLSNKSSATLMKKAEQEIKERLDAQSDIVVQLSAARIGETEARNVPIEYGPDTKAMLETLRRGYSALFAFEEQATLKQEAIRQQRKAAAEDAVRETSNALAAIAQSTLDAQIAMIDAELDYRESRLYRAQELAERGNTEALKREEERIDQLTKKREDAARRQIQLNALMQASEMALAAAQSIGAIVKAAAEGDPYTIALRVAAAVAAIVGGIAAISSAFSQAGSGFYTGGYTGDGGKYDVAGTVHKGEFVFDQDKTRKFRPLFEAIHNNRIKMPEQLSIPQVNIPVSYNDKYASRGEVELLSRKMDGVIEAINNISVSARQDMNQYGLTQSIEFVKRIDRQRFK